MSDVKSNRRGRRDRREKKQVLLCVLGPSAVNTYFDLANSARSAAPAFNVIE
jgi:hypothetical protein